MSGMQLVTAHTVRQVLAEPAEATLPGRAVLALSRYLDAERHWLANQPQGHGWARRRAADAARHAGEYVARLLDGQVFRVPWTGHADGTATVEVDGLRLWYARGQVFLLVDCPAGGEPHTARVHGLAELGELVGLATLEPPPPPWSCTALCRLPRANSMAAALGKRMVFLAGVRYVDTDYQVTTTCLAGSFELARQTLAVALGQQVQRCFTDGDLEVATAMAEAADSLPMTAPRDGAWQAEVAGWRYWLHQRPDPTTNNAGFSVNDTCGDRLAADAGAGPPGSAGEEPHLA
jgi:hypothetical protein